MTIKQIDDDKASWAADQFIDYFQNFTNLEEYLRHVKKSVVTKSSILDDPKDDFFGKNTYLTVSGHGGVSVPADSKDRGSSARLAVRLVNHRTSIL